MVHIGWIELPVSGPRIGQHAHEPDDHGDKQNN
jgi:hypothetical protein